MNATIKKLYNVLVVGGALAAAACDRPGQRAATTPSADAAAPTPAAPRDTPVINRSQHLVSDAPPATAPGAATPPTDAASVAPPQPGSTAAGAAPVTPPPAQPAAGGVRGWFGG